MSQPHVLIIGGGIGGLALANGLKKHNVSFHVYERDENIAFRAQGYRIRIAGEGITALEQLLDQTAWDNFKLTCADMRFRNIAQINSQTGERSQMMWGGRPMPTTSHPPDAKPPETVDRTLLRQVLLRGVGEGVVTYGKALDHYSETSEGVVAHFVDGTSATGTLLIGADGKHSAVRTQFLPNQEILDTGGRCLYGRTPLTPEIVAEIEPEVLGGMSAIKDRTQEDDLSTIAEPVTFPRRAEMDAAGFDCPENYLYWVLASQPERMKFKRGEVPHLSLEEAAQRALEVTADWHPSLRSIFEHQQEGETAALMISSVKPDFGTWEPNPRVTILGDAAHLMGPTAGSGAITALRDARHLCEILVSEGQTREAIGKYETLMREYASETVKMSWMGAKHIIGLRSSDSKGVAEVMKLLEEGGPS